MTQALNNIEKLKQIQDMLKTTTHSIKLPRIVCIGTQSSGKSSVLEKLLQRDILPKGKDITTRCPIEINTRKTDKDFEYAMIDDKMVKSFGKIKQHILKAMNDNCGEGITISHKKVVLDVYLKNSMEISLIDLPGLTQIPLVGQPCDIDMQLERMALEYIKDESTIIMAIVAANIDISTAEVLKLAKRVDPDGARTLGVLTKIDLMDKDTDCYEILTNKITRLEKGFVGCINRGQSQLNTNFQLAAHFDQEKKYFENSEVYKKLVPKIGSLYLIERVNEIFSELLDSELPNLKIKINRDLDDIESSLSQHEVQLDKSGIFASYSKTLRNILKEKYFKNEYIFRYSQSKSILVDFKNNFQIAPENYVFDDKLKDEIKNSNSVFISEKLFKRIVSERFATLRGVVFNSFDKSMNVILKHIESIESDSYKKLPFAIHEKIKRKLTHQCQALKVEYDRFLLIQNSFINVSHPDFSKQNILRNVLKKYVNQKRVKGADRNLMFFFNTNKSDIIEFDEEFDISLIFDFSNTYFECYKKFFVDYGMKMAHFYFIDYLITEFKKCDDFMGLEPELFKENPELIKKMKKLVDNKSINKAILNILNM